MRWWRAFLAAALMTAGMAGCAPRPDTPRPLAELEWATPDGSPFTQALAREYRAFAEAERVHSDRADSQLFAEKGLAAAHGTAVTPEDPAEWGIADEETGRQLSEARGKLLDVLASNAPSRVPSLTATAQVKFDCWLEHHHQGRPAADTERCRNDFMAALTAIATVPAPGGIAAPPHPDSPNSLESPLPPK